MTDIMTPALGESVTEATVAKWAKKAGDAVHRDEVLVELETDKVNLEVAASEDGILAEISVPEGDTVVPGQRLGRVTSGSTVAKAGPTETGPPPPPQASPRPVSAAPPVEGKAGERNKADEPPPAKAPPPLSPAVRRIVAERGLAPESLAASGRNGRSTKADALAALEARRPPPIAPPAVREVHEREERAPMTRLRQTIARRLKEAQNSAAMLTTFNEVDLSAVMEIRRRYKDDFDKRHGVKLGLMGLFVKACVSALKSTPEVNAEIDGPDLIYKNHYDIGVAVGTPRGLVVPVVRDADLLGLAEVEKQIAALGRKAREGTLAIEDLQGGTFTITNGGVYGSLMSTPILNAPQSGILGMHKIQDRPVVVAGEIVVRPMMYLALSYDHRVVDGQGAVTFLVHVKDVIEDPRRLLLEI